jgi:hypothetical protein
MTNNNNITKTGKRLISRKAMFVPDDDRLIHWGKLKGSPASCLLDCEDSYLRWLLTTEDDFAVWEKQYLAHHGIEMEA